MVTVTLVQGTIQSSKRYGDGFLKPGDKGPMAVITRRIGKSVKKYVVRATVGLESPGSEDFYVCESSQQQRRRGH